PYRPPESHHPADIADVLWLDFQPEECRRLFGDLPLETAAEVLAESEPALLSRLIPEMPAERIADLIGRISNDDSVDVLEVLPEERRHEVLAHVAPHEARELRHLGEYPADSAGGLMTTEFLTAAGNEKVGDILKRLKRDQGEAETFSAIYLLDGHGVLLGVVSTRDLLEANIHDELGEVMNPDPIVARVEEDREDVARRILHYNLSAIPVVDARGVPIGIITADDALEVLEAEGSEDALLLAGAGAESSISETVLQKAARRAPMLLLTVFGGMFLARLMDFFLHRWALRRGIAADGQQDLGALVAYVPLVLALAGNVGQQTAAVLVRGIAVGQIRKGRGWQVMRSEIRVGALLGVLCSLLAGGAAAVLTHDVDSGMAIGLSLLLAMTWTTFVSSGIVLGSESLGFDPALVAGPFMMVVSDISGVTMLFLSHELITDLL
ncbi:MAG TPA: magnesium transporter, partial [Planctomycetota bacterium]